MRGWIWPTIEIVCVFSLVFPMGMLARVALVVRRDLKVYTTMGTLILTWLVALLVAHDIPAMGRELRDAYRKGDL